jgi:hypothetical protein
LGLAATTAAEPVADYAAAVLAEPGQVAVWRFDGDLRDAKGGLHGQPGGAGGSPSYVAGPGGGQALALAKGRFMSMGATPELDLPQTTVELWFRLQAPASSHGCNPCLIAKRSNQPDDKATRFSVHV